VCAYVCVRMCVSASRATVEQSSESKGSASIRRYLMIMVAASRGVKPHTGQPQSATCESTLAPGSVTAPLWRNPTSDRHYCQGTNPPSRRPITVLRGSSGGEEATKKLLAIGSVKGKLPSPPRHEEKPACNKGAARARNMRLKARSSRLTFAFSCRLQATSSAFKLALPSAACIRATLSISRALKVAMTSPAVGPKVRQPHPSLARSAPPAHEQLQEPRLSSSAPCATRVKLPAA